jgi:DeoR family ulaG and ulaABCDEF operon transcriptional repressor
MHERERHRIITSAVGARPIATVQELVELTGASEATIRRDIAALAGEGRVRKVRGGAEALVPARVGTLAGRSFRQNETTNAAEKRAIARAAVDLVGPDETIIVNGGTTTFQMVHFLAAHRVQIFTNSFPVAEHLLKHSRNTVMLPAGTIYREQNIILSPFEDDGSRRVVARRAFIGAEAVGPHGAMESDSLLLQSEQRLIRQAEDIVLLVDSTKFTRRASLVLCPLSTIATVITDDRLTDADARLVEAAGARLIVAPVPRG